MGATKSRVPLAVRIWAKVDRSETLSQCWLWNGNLDASDYGQFGGIKVHRWTWEQVNGQIPKGMEIDHLCRNRRCVRPDHLELVTHLENVQRGRAYAKWNQI